MCKEEHDVQFLDRFVEWLALLKAEEEATGHFDPHAYVNNLRTLGLDDSQKSAAAIVSIKFLL